MFGLLKDKLSGFVSSLIGRGEKKASEEEKKLAEAAEKGKEELPKPSEGKIGIAEPPGKPGKIIEIAEPAPMKEGTEPETKFGQKPAETPLEIRQTAEPKPAAAAEKTAEMPHEKKPEPERKKGIFESIAEAFSKKGGKGFEPSFERLSKAASAGGRKIEAKPGIVSQIKSAFSDTVEISEGDVADLLDGLELSLLESDVAYEVSVSLTQELRKKLVGRRIPKGRLQQEVQSTVREVLVDAMTSQKAFALAERLATFEKPAKILFIGPNGAGKTTTMAKLAHQLSQSGLRVVFSASDTFRAAAIEQTEEHAGRLGIKVVKGKYGQDPASVGFEAISYAKAHGIDVVMIDSAGRQDTNQNLLDELKKIVRVCKPDLKIYIGESIGGNAVIEQIRAFDSAVGLDGAILTKLDCDAKGGTAISVTKATGIPVLYVGVGQRYEDLVPFSPSAIAQDIVNYPRLNT